MQGTPVSTLDTSDPNTYVDTGLTLNLTVLQVRSITC